jgi:hypothetical protein
MEDSGTNTAVNKNIKIRNAKSNILKLPLITPFPNQNNNKEFSNKKNQINLFNSLDTSPRKLEKNEKKKSIQLNHHLNNSNILNDDLFNEKIFNTQLNVINPNKFHNCVFKKIEKNLVLDSEKDDEEKIEKKQNQKFYNLIMKNYIQNQIEDYMFDKLYRRRNINKKIRNIVKTELKNAKKKLHREDNYSISKSIDLKKPLYLANIDKIKFISYQNPFLQVNRNGNVPYVLNDSEIMFNLFKKGINIFNQKASKLV